MRATYRMPCMCWLALLFLVHGSTTEAPDALFNSDIESLNADDTALLRDLVLLDTGKSTGTSALQMELEGLVDADGKPVFSEANATDTETVTPPKVMTEADIDAMNGNGPAADPSTLFGPVAHEGPPKYNKIPYLSLSEASTEHNGATLESCQRICDDELDKCKSFTYIADKQRCLISATHLQYDLEFSFLVKHQPEEGGEPVFKSLGAIKYDAKNLKKATATPGLPKQKCRENCATDVKCNSLTYRARDQLCITSSQTMSYNTEATYFEKQGVAAEALQDERKSAEAADEAQLPPIPDAPDGPMHDEPSKKEQDKEIKAKAALTPAQLRYVKHMKSSDGTSEVQRQVLQNALLGVNTEVKAKNDAKVKAAQRAAEMAHKKEKAKQAAENLFKLTEKNAMKESTNKLQELVEGGSKSEEKAAEAASKSEEQSKENAGKEALRLKHSKTCEVTEKNEEKSDLEVAKLLTQKGDSCTQASVAVREKHTVSEQLKAAIKEGTKWENQLTTGTQRLVFVSEKREIKQIEEKLEDTSQKQDAVNKRYLLVGDQIEKIKAAMPALDTRVATAQNDAAKFKSERDAAEMAIKSATGALATTAKATLAGATSSLAKAEIELTAANTALKAKQDKITKLNVGYYQDKARKQRLEAEVSALRVQLSQAKSKYMTDNNAAKLKIDVAKHQLPLAKTRESNLRKDLKAKEGAVSKSDKACTDSSMSLNLRKQELKQYKDEQVVCTAERKEKATAKAKALDEFEAQKAAYDLKLAKRREADFAKAMAGAELSMQSAATMEEKVAAGSKLADVRSSQMMAEQSSLHLAPKVQTTEMAEAAASAKEASAKAVQKEDESKVQKDAQEVKKDEAKIYQTDPKNPKVIIENAKKLLENLMHEVGMAEIAAGEHDTTEADMANTTRMDNHTASNHTHTHQVIQSDVNGNSANISVSAALNRAAQEAAAGHGAAAAALIKTAEAEREAETRSPTPAPFTAQGQSATDQAKAIIAQVKHTAEVGLVAQAKREAQSALQNEQEIANKDAAKEAKTKADIKEMEDRIAQIAAKKKHQEALNAARRQSMAGQWPFTGSAQDDVGAFGSANIHGGTWATDDTYGKCLSLAASDAEVDLGDLKFTTGTISMWVKQEQKGSMRLFGPGMEVPVTSEHLNAEVDTAVEKAVQATAQNGLATEMEKAMPSLGESAQPGDQIDGSGTIKLVEDGSVSVFDGVSQLSLAPQESVEAGRWYQLGFVFTKSSVTLYINGALQHTVSCKNDFNGHPLIIGRGFVGSIMNVDFWTRVLLRAEVANLPKPAADHDEVKFVAHSAEGKYELAKSKADDLMRREDIQRAKMQAAEKDVKKQEKEKEQRELSEKAEMKAEKERRDELAMKDKVSEQSQKDAHKERDTKERKSKSDEESEKDAAKTKEREGKQARKEVMDKAEERQKQEEQRAAKERQEKAEKRQEEVNEINTKEKSHKTDLKSQQETQAKETKSKEEKIRKEQEDDEKRQQSEAEAARERVSKGDEAQRSEVANKENIQKSGVAKEVQEKAVVAPVPPVPVVVQPAPVA